MLSKHPGIAHRGARLLLGKQRNPTSSPSGPRYTPSSSPFFVARASTSTANSSASHETDQGARSGPQTVKPGEVLQSALDNIDLVVRPRGRPTGSPRTANSATLSNQSRVQQPEAGPSGSSTVAETAPHGISSLPVRSPILKTNSYAEIYDADAAEFDDDLLEDASGNGRSTSDSEKKGSDATKQDSPNFIQLTANERLHFRRNYVLYETLNPVSGSGAVRSEKYVISHARLRDACTCRLCVDPSTQQKISFSGHVAHYNSGTGRPAGLVGPMFRKWRANDGAKPLVVFWPTATNQRDDKSASAEDAIHRSNYSLRLIRSLAGSRERQAFYLEGLKRRVLWNGEDLQTKSPDFRTSYTEMILPDETRPSPLVLRKVLAQLHVYGVAIIEGVPTDTTEDKDCKLRIVANWLGEIRNTFYGETWDVKSVRDSKNIAYTNLNLGLHMDLLYFSSPPRFQLLHCLRNRVEGGSSYFVDSFAQARSMQNKHPRLAEALQRHKLSYKYDNDGHYLFHSHPVLPDPLDFSRLHSAVNWSPPFQSTIGPLVPRTLAQKSANDIRHELETEKTFFEALHTFEEHLDHPKARYEYTMKEGDLVLFDNRRVLHARTAFRDKTEEERKRDGVEIVEGEPTRWLKGCYIDGEAVWDKLVSLELNKYRQEHRT